MEREEKWQAGLRGQGTARLFCVPTPTSQPRSSSQNSEAAALPLSSLLSPAPGRQSPSPLPIPLSYPLLLPRWVLDVIAPFRVKTQGRGNNAQMKQSCQRGEETLSRQKVPLPNNISVSACTMLSCPAPLSHLYGKYYINGFVQIDS